MDSPSRSVLIYVLSTLNSVWREPTGLLKDKCSEAHLDGLKIWAMCLPNATLFIASCRSSGLSEIMQSSSAYAKIL